MKSLTAVATCGEITRHFLTSYMGWKVGALSFLPEDEESWKLEDVLKIERKPNFRMLHPDGLCVSETALKKDYFFTDGILDKFKIQPDHLVVNPNYRSGPPMRLHRRGKIGMLRLRKDISMALDDVASKRIARSAAAKNAHAVKSAAWLAQFKTESDRVHLSANITLNDVDRRICVRQGINMADFKEIDPGALVRWRVNALRHEFTPYDAVLISSMPPGSTGNKCYIALQEHVLGLIGKAFPELANECARQLDRKRDIY